MPNHVLETQCHHSHNWWWSYHLHMRIIESDMHLCIWKTMSSHDKKTKKNNHLQLLKQSTYDLFNTLYGFMNQTNFIGIISNTWGGVILVIYMWITHKLYYHVRVYFENNLVCVRMCKCMSKKGFSSNHFDYPHLTMLIRKHFNHNTVW